MLFSTFDLTKKKSCLLRKQKIIWKDISGIYLNISKLNFFFNSTGYQILITYHDHNLTYSFTVKGGIFGGNFKCLLRGGLTRLRSSLCETLFTFIFDESRGTKNVRPQAQPNVCSPIARVINILRVVTQEKGFCEFCW